MSYQQVWGLLKEANLVSGEPPQRPEPSLLWYLKALLVFTGFFSSLLMLGYLISTFPFIYSNTAGSLISALLAVFVARLLLVNGRQSAFLGVAYTLSLLGQGLVIWVLFEHLHTDQSILWLLFALLQILLALIMPDNIHRLLSSAIALISIALATVLVGEFFSYTLLIFEIVGSVALLAAATIWLHEFRYLRYRESLQAVAYGLLLAATVLNIIGQAKLILYLLDFGTTLGVGSNLIWVSSLLPGLVLLYVTWQLLSKNGFPLRHPLAITALAGSLLLALASVHANGVAMGTIALVLGFSAGNRTLMGLGILSLILYIGNYYYQLDTTLLVKSLSMLLIGLVLLGTRQIVLYLTKADAVVKP